MAINDSVQEHAIIQFSSDVHVRMQQKQSRLKPYCMEKKMTGKAMAYDGIGTVELGTINGRYQAVDFSEMEHWRRKITKARFGATLPIDDYDINERLTNPESGYAEALAAAANRQYDRVAYGAMFADVLTGEDFDTTVTFAGEGGLTVDATSGLTYEKLLEIHENFMDNEVGNESDVKLCMGITGNEYVDLMSELELTSGDYTSEYVVADGRIRKATGIDLIPFAANGAGGANPILTVASGTRTSFCMAQGAICVAVAMQWAIKVQDRNDLYQTKQVQIVGTLGAVRTEAKLIQKVTTTAS